MREQKEQEKQNELLRVVAEQNHERLIEYDVKEDRAVVYAIENDRFEVLFDIEDYVKKNHYGSVFIDPEDKKVFRRAMHACLQKEGTVTVDVRYCEKENQPEVLKLVARAKKEFPDKSVWIYSGFTFEELLGGSRASGQTAEEILKLADVLVDGRFDKTKKNISLKFRGSENQRIIDLKPSLLQKKAIIKEI